MQFLPAILLLVVILATANAQINFPDAKPAAEGDNNKSVDVELFEALSPEIRQGFSPAGGGPSCFTPDRLRGTCVPFSGCREYVRLASRLRDPTVFTFLRSRICRLVGNRVHLCCPQANPVLLPNPQPPVTNPQPPPPSSNLIPTEDECGLPSAPRVVGGVETKEGRWPWLAGVGIFVSGNFFPVCGGTVITRRHVLTASHCFGNPQQPDPDSVRIGEHDITNPNDGQVQDFRIAGRRGNSYNRATNENDIEILVLSGTMLFGDYAQPACLPFNLRSSTFLGESLTVVGWGRTSYENQRNSNVPMEADLPVVDTRTCNRNYDQLSVKPVIDGRNLCAGNGVQDSCAGDSGGPLNYLGNNGRYYVVGIVSFGVRCAEPQYPGVYTKVSSFVDWITNTVQQS